MKINNPLQYKFSTDNGYYIFDGKTGRLYKLNRATYQMFEDFDLLTEEELFAKFRNDFTREEITDAYQILGQLSKSPLFLEGPLQQRLAPPESKVIRDSLEHGLKKVTLELTEACNLRCKYCVYSGGYRYYRKHGFQKMSLSTAIKAVNFYVRHSSEDEEFKVVSFYGGEPLLNFPLLREMVTYVRRHPKLGDQTIMNLTTNGTLLSEEAIDFLVYHGVGVTISIDGPEAHHNRYRVYQNGHGTFQQVMKNIKLLKAKSSETYFSQRVMFNCVITPTTDLMDLYEFFSENEILFPFGKIKISFVNEGNRDFFKLYPGNPDKIIRDSRILREYYSQSLLGTETRCLNFLEGLIGESLLRIHRRMQFNIATNEMNIEPSCIPGEKRLYVTIDGSLHICERLSTSSFILGNVEDGFNIPFIESLMGRIYEMANRKECLHCWAILFCDACYQKQAVFYNSQIQDEDFIHPSETGFCNGLRSDTKDFLQLYCEMRERNGNIFDFMDKVYYIR